MRSYTCPGSVALLSGVFLLLAAVQDGIHGAKLFVPSCGVGSSCSSAVDTDSFRSSLEPVLVDAPHDHDTRNASPPPGSSALPLCGFFGRDKSKSSDVVEIRPPLQMNKNNKPQHREQEDEYITLRGYHGTRMHNLPGIYVQGWQESIRGHYGPGLYLTNKLATAEHYAWKSFPWPAVPTVMLVTYRVRRDRVLDAVLLLQPREVEDQDLDGTETTVAPTNSSSSLRSPGRSSSDRSYCYRSGSPLNSVSGRRLLAIFPAAAEDYDVLFRVNQVVVQVDKVEILSTRPLAFYGTALGVKRESRWRGESADSVGDLTRENLQKLGYSSEEIRRAVT